MQKHRRKLLGLLTVSFILGATLRVANSMMEPSHQLGVADGLLAACPDSPNCVCTQSETTEHKITPIKFTGSSEEALDRLESIVRGMRRTKVVSRAADYLHAEFRTFWLGYVDDVEFYIDADAGLIHFRSASRVGYSDLGVNRTRMEDIRQQFQSR